jgi:hypothetical protein
MEKGRAVVTLGSFPAVLVLVSRLTTKLATIATLGHMVWETRNDHPGKARHAGKTTTNPGEYVCCHRISAPDIRLHLAVAITSSTQTRD